MSKAALAYTGLAPARSPGKSLRISGRPQLAIVGGRDVPVSPHLDPDLDDAATLLVSSGDSAIIGLFRQWVVSMNYANEPGTSEEEVERRADETIVIEGCIQDFPATNGRDLAAKTWVALHFLDGFSDPAIPAMLTDEAYGWTKSTMGDIIALYPELHAIVLAGGK